MRAVSILIGWMCTTAWSAQPQPLAYDSHHNIEYAGVTSPSGVVEFFKGIHYAQDTSGAHRFAPPRPLPKPAPGTVINATIRGAACPQLIVRLPGMFDKPHEISEDCLSLHIARPAGLNTTSETRLPVLAWIPGGAAAYGSGSDPHTDPEKLIELSLELESPVIFVGINYRLSIFGFAASDTLKQQKSMNVGMRDQRLALEWIKENIATFGGDPDRITAYGLSAGGTYISYHHVSYAGEKGVPFNQAYMMSGPTGTGLNQTSDHVKVNTANVAQRLNCSTTGQDMLDCLRDVPTERLTEVAYAYALEVHPPVGVFVFVSTLDDDILVDRPSKLLREGRFVKGVPCIVAWTEDDAASFVGPAALIQSEDDMWKALDSWNGPLLDHQQKANLLKAYPASEFEDDAAAYNARRSPGTPSLTSHYYRTTAFLRDLLFTCSSIEFAYYMQKHSQAGKKSFDNVWLYQLNQSIMASVYHDMGIEYFGAIHGSDTNYIFNGVFPEGKLGEADKILARKFTASVINFVTNGNPATSSGFDSWPKAFDGIVNLEKEQDDMPSDVNLLVVGGPYGTTPVHISKSTEAGINVDDKPDAGDSGLYDRVSEGLDNLQQIILGKMQSTKTVHAQGAIERQKLFQRCKFINSLAETMGV